MVVELGFQPDPQSKADDGELTLTDMIDAARDDLSSQGLREEEIDAAIQETYGSFS